MMGRSQAGKNAPYVVLSKTETATNLFIALLSYRKASLSSMRPKGEDCKNDTLKLQFVLTVGTN